MAVRGEAGCPAMYTTSSLGPPPSVKGSEAGLTGLGQEERKTAAHRIKSEKTALRARPVPGVFLFFIVNSLLSLG
jgi:hypothetical protein